MKELSAAGIQKRRELIRFIITFRWPFRLLIFALALIASVSGLLVPFYQKKFIEALDLMDLFICSVLTLISFMCFQLTIYVGTREALFCQSKLSQFLYEHILNLKFINSNSKDANKTTGEKVALYTTDIPSGTMWLEQSLPYILTTFIPLALTPYFLKRFYSLPYSFSLLIVAIMVSFNLAMAFRQSIFFYRFKILAAERMGLVNEWIQNIKSLKTLSWVIGFEKKILVKRVEETENRIQMVTNGQIMNSFSSTITFWLNLCVLAFLFWRLSEHHTDQIHKSDIFVLLWVMGIFLSRPLRQLPWLFTMMFDAFTSVTRLVNFLKLRNTPSSIKHQQKTSDHSVLEVQKLQLAIDGLPLLKDIDLSIQEGELVALIGPIGCGKSLLLKSILNETPFHAQQLYHAPASYLPQESFIMSASIQDNIAFEYDTTATQKHLHQALEQAEFDIYEDRLPEGLKTEIGERGLNLSGGQKQRLNLARIFFNPQKLLLLDDPFSAVDIGTEQKLIQSLIALKKQKHSLLVTTQRHSFLKHCDRVLYMQEGRILFDGQFKDLEKDKILLEFLQ